MLVYQRVTIFGNEDDAKPPLSIRRRPHWASPARSYLPGSYESWSHRLLVPVHAQPAVANTHSQLDP